MKFPLSYLELTGGIPSVVFSVEGGITLPHKYTSSGISYCLVGRRRCC